MQSLKTKALVLSRTNYAEADRIITVLTPEHGKLRLMARGARTLKSKLAGGIELFALNDISYIRGKSELGTLISARLDQYFSQILNDIERVQFGYDLLRTINRLTEDQTEPAYFHLVAVTLEGLNDLDIPLDLVKLWFYAQLLDLSGQSPNLTSDKHGAALTNDDQFSFDISAMAFSATEGGQYLPEQIKFLRLCFGAQSPKALSRVINADQIAKKLMPLISTLHQHQL